VRFLNTPVGAVWRPAQDRHIYLLWIALVWAGMLFGFLPDLGRYFAEKPAPPWILDIHGIVNFVWLALVTVQIILIEVKRPALHRRLGWAIVVVSVAMVPLWLVAAMVDQARQIHHSDYAPQFLGLEFQATLIFPLLLAAGTILRRDLAAHKRLMILAAISILDPGTARAFANFSPWTPPGAAGWWVSYFWGNVLLTAAMMGWDWWKKGSVHPALLAGAGLLALGEAAAVWLEFAPWWHTDMIGLVHDWRWAG
jgi:FtsH-binding integral membrane protein